MSDFVNPSSEIRLATVPFGVDQKNIISFHWQKHSDNTDFSHAEMKDYQLEQFTNNFVTQTYTNLNIIKHDKNYIDLRGNFDLYDRFNYMIFRNSDTDNKWWYCFVKDVTYIANLTTRIEFIVDSWNTFQFDIVYYKSWIERSHGEYTTNIGANLEPEPVGYLDIVESVIDESNFDWSPKLYLQSTSNPVTRSGRFPDYQVGGVGAGIYNTPFYYYEAPEDIKQFIIDKGWNNDNAISDNIARYLEFFGDYMIYAMKAAFNPENPPTPPSTPAFDSNIDHRSDLIGIIVRPTFMHDSSAFNNGMLTSNASNLVSEQLELNSGVGNTLSYHPVNAKVLSSLFCKYRLFNLNGFSMEFRPELITYDGIDDNVDKLNVSISGKIVEGDLSVVVNNYHDYRKNHAEIPYAASRQIAYDENASVEKTLEKYGGLISAGISTAGNVAGLIATGGAVEAGSISASRGVARGLSSVNEDVGGISGALLNAERISEDNPVVKGDASSNIFRYGAAYVKLKLGKSTPTTSQCVHLDNFFNMFGYAQNTIGNPYSNMHNRARWDYIKTDMVNLKVNAPAKYEEDIKLILNSGVTVWHTISGFGDYSNPQTNI